MEKARVHTPDLHIGRRGRHHAHSLKTGREGQLGRCRSCAAKVFPGCSRGREWQECNGLVHAAGSKQTSA